MGMQLTASSKPLDRSDIDASDAGHQFVVKVWLADSWFAIPQTTLQMSLDGKENLLQTPETIRIQTGQGWTKVTPEEARDAMAQPSLQGEQPIVRIRREKLINQPWSVIKGTGWALSGISNISNQGPAVHDLPGRDSGHLDDVLGSKYQRSQSICYPGDVLMLSFAPAMVLEAAAVQHKLQPRTLRKRGVKSTRKTSWAYGGAGWLRAMQHG
ncbi:hypothetical protein EDD36DRAFT_422628 [Exophiala viscosa]|uniref:Uncharacterized protein n=1 Tax=Exophiala viscosa TaxID=2486360 RepID=A0AAN6DQH6_9EURO|nr:hypothetical protein EDD36DRAFT_422628 [Exophiala viscosa]